MDIESIVGNLERLTDQSGKSVQSMMTGDDLNNPAKLVKVQFALQQYSVFIGFNSAVMKMVKDMVMGIIAKI
ncbi:type III secretion system needle protein SsaG [Chitinimonas arctica]|uniref:Type III secretion system needle protein SsaG n=1 Tax=Chitinimonas arctica TaxID=2594795 RepID=A0A516SA96_9NEIS|nr:type III secretion system needle filament subunit SctF [Chitinimonas arctica]QDQ25075.1 type III secretion system needle protein SsaG [Chitinimonas arctica]